jgi:DNA-binding transcriptional MerR regulator
MSSEVVGNLGHMAAAQPPATGAAAASLDIDELARRAGTTVRTVRMYQERGLLPPPERHGRRAAYREEHLIRLRLVQRLADRGYSLAAIKDLTAAWDARHGLAHVLGLEGAVAEPLQHEPARRYTTDELAALVPADEELTGLTRALEIGLLAADGEEFVTANPGLVDAGARLVAAGMPLDVALELAAATLAAADDLAERFVTAFVEHIWAPFEQAGEPDADAPAMAREIREKRTLAVQAVAAVMAHAMDLHTDRVIMSRPAPR